MSTTIADTLLARSGRDSTPFFHMPGHSRSASFVEHLHRLRRTNETFSGRPSLLNEIEEQAKRDDVDGQEGATAAESAGEGSSGTLDEVEHVEGEHSDADTETSSDSSEAANVDSQSAPAGAQTDSSNAQDETQVDSSSGETVVLSEAVQQAPLTLKLLNSLILSGQRPEPLARFELRTPADQQFGQPLQSNIGQPSNTSVTANTQGLFNSSNSHGDRTAIAASTSSASSATSPATHTQSTCSDTEAHADLRTTADQSSSAAPSSSGAQPTSTSSNSSTAAATTASVHFASTHVAAKTVNNSPTNSGSSQPLATDIAALAKLTAGKLHMSANNGHTSKDHSAFSARTSAHAAHSASTSASSAEAMVASQASRGVLAALNQRGGSVTIRLSPEHLGPMRVHVKLKEGSIAARFETSSDSARDLLTRSIGTLKTTLEDRGYTVESLHVHAAEPHEKPSTFGALREHEHRAPTGDGSSEHGRSSDYPSHDARDGARTPREEPPDHSGTSASDARLGEPPLARDQDVGEWGMWGEGTGNGLPNSMTEWSRVKINIPIAHTAEPRAQSIDALA